MKRTILLKTLLATLLLSFQSIRSFAYDFEVDSLYYNITSSENLTVEVTCENSYSYYEGDIVIPSSVQYNGTTYSVTSIGYEAFASCINLTSIMIPNSVTSIGDRAFFVAFNIE